MRLYAQAPVRRTGQLLGDLGLVAWTWLWVWVGGLVRDMVSSLAQPVSGIQARASDLSRTLRDASSSVGDLPMVGDRLRTPFDQASGTGEGIARQSGDLVNRIHDVGSLLGLVVAAVPIVLVGAWWIARRLSFARQAAVAQRFVDADADLDLFALRAMASQPLERLERITPDPVGAWRRQDADVIRRLAALELRERGLRPPG